MFACLAVLLCFSFCFMCWALMCFRNCVYWTPHCHFGLDAASVPGICFGFSVYLQWLCSVVLKRGGCLHFAPVEVREVVNFFFFFFSFSQARCISLSVPLTHLDPLISSIRLTRGTPFFPCLFMVVAGQYGRCFLPYPGECRPKPRCLPIETPVRCCACMQVLVLATLALCTKSRFKFSFHNPKYQRLLEGPDTKPLDSRLSDTFVLTVSSLGQAPPQLSDMSDTSLGRRFLFS